ncbi:hypothetical protein [Zobellia barbeyronii]|uniref:Uncharacterized protein n=1 Tax=Zobellia barbeyronii TaxID=2748009 RepID=A0ABS5WES5_9FLAO|nr:hypothetical protein [Zobellia barbeyronii]MBT2161441.1 hypothetical protein [Zobellia barbeyronii]
MECLHQLLKVYVISELQYTYDALRASSPLKKTFMEQRAIERSDFVLDIYRTVTRNNGKGTLTDLYNLHKQLYGEDYLHTHSPLPINMSILDRKALEICNCMLLLDIPDALRFLLTEQVRQIESSLLGLVYIQSLTEN